MFNLPQELLLSLSAGYLLLVIILVVMLVVVSRYFWKVKSLVEESEVNRAAEIKELACWIESAVIVEPEFIVTLSPSEIEFYEHSRKKAGPWHEGKVDEIYVDGNPFLGASEFNLFGSGGFGFVDGEWEVRRTRPIDHRTVQVIEADGTTEVYSWNEEKQTYERLKPSHFSHFGKRGEQDEAAGTARGAER